MSTTKKKPKQRKKDNSLTVKLNQLNSVIDTFKDIITISFKYKQNIAFENITSISICDNKLRYFPDDVDILCNLTQLDISRNKIESLPEKLSELTKLKVLYINANSIFELPKSFTKLTSLEKFSGRSNSFYLFPEQLLFLNSLVRIDLCGNYFACAIPYEIGKLENLKEYVAYHYEGHPPPSSLVKAIKTHIGSWSEIKAVHSWKISGKSALEFLELKKILRIFPKYKDLSLTLDGDRIITLKEFCFRELMKKLPTKKRAEFFKAVDGLPLPIELKQELYCATTCDTCKLEILEPFATILDHTKYLVYYPICSWKCIPQEKDICFFICK